MYHLTFKGQVKSKFLELYCLDAAQAFEELSNEIGFDSQSVLNFALTALKNNPFGKRFPESQQSYKKRVAINKGKDA